MLSGTVIFEEHGIPVELYTGREVRRAIENGRLRPDTIVRTGIDSGQVVVRRAQDVEELRPYFNLGLDTPATSEPSETSQPNSSPSIPAAADPVSGGRGVMPLDSLTHFPVEMSEGGRAPVALPKTKIHSTVSDGFWTWAIQPLTRYADFSGRSRRKEYWCYAIAQLGILLVSVLMPPVLVLLVLLLIIPNLAVTVRRLHDQDKSGWFILVNFIPYVGWLILLILMFVEGSHGPNRFGPDPKERNLDGVFRWPSAN